MATRLRRVALGTAIGLAIATVGIGLAAWLHVLPVGATTSLSLPTAAVNAEAQDGMTPIAHMTAPNFDLVDQSGRRVALSDFRGKAVVLTFLDPVCWYQCPLQAQEMKLMLQYLPKSARSRVALVAVVANPVVHSLSAVRAFDRTEHLSGLGNWYYLTSPSVPALRQVWSRYFVSVAAPRNTMVDHSQCFYLISPSGQVRYLSEPSDAETAFVGTAELLAAYTAKILGQSASFPPGSPPLASLLPRFASAPPAQSDASVGTTMVTPREGWKVAWRGGYELLYRTTDGGRTWRNVSPAGVTKKGGILAAYGSAGEAWVVVLPWGYTLTPLTFYTSDWGVHWRYTGVWPAQSTLPSVVQPLTAQGATAYWLTRQGLWRAQGGAPWQRVSPLPQALPRDAALRAVSASQVRLTGVRGTLTWRQGAGWQTIGP